jgi:SAM-dependent methyltransferase
MYDYYLGGRDNYEVDRDAAHRVLEIAPDTVDSARANRDFLRRAVRHLAESGVRQIIDIGTGIPTSPNTHEIAHSVSPDIRVAYVDNDPIVATHADARLLGSGNTGFFLGDVRDPGSILGHPTIGELIDVREPVALMLVSVLHFIPDEDDPAGLLAAYRDALAPGSHLVLSHGTADLHREAAEEALEVYRKLTVNVRLRSHAEVTALFDGFELIEPGLVQVPLWHPDGPPPTAEELRKVAVYGGIGRLKEKNA